MSELLKPREYQLDGINKIKQWKRVLVGDAPGLGKSLLLDCPVLTPNGFVKNGDLKLEDFVTGKNGKPTEVIGIYPQPEKDYYKITFTDNTQAICCDEHLWEVNIGKFNMVLPLFEIKKRMSLISNISIPMCDVVGGEELKDWYIYKLSRVVRFVRYRKQDIYRIDIKKKGNEHIVNNILALGGYIVNQTNKVLYFDVPFDLQYKTPRPFKVPPRCFKSIEFYKRSIGQCIKVAAPDGLFLINDYIVTHNTGQAILAVNELNVFPSLVIVPASLKINWEVEVKKWTNKTAVILNDGMQNTFHCLYQAGFAQYFICNYDSLQKYFVAGGKINKKAKDITLQDIVFNGYIDFFKSIIIDEFHRCKDVKALQSKLVRGLVSKDKTGFKEVIIGMTGTVVVNKVNDLAAQLSILGRINEFGGYTNFIKKYENATPEELTKLGIKLRETCYYRRESTELKELPPKVRQAIVVPLSNQDEYNCCLKDLKVYLKDWKEKTDVEIRRAMRGEIMVKMSNLIQIAALGKSEAALEYIQSLNEQGEKTVLFAWHKEPLKYVIEKLKCSSIIGADSVIDRNINLQRFQNDATCMNIACSKAAGEGLTMTAARMMIMLEMGWNPATMEQREARIFRMGQLKQCHFIYFLGENTIDRHIFNMIEKKRDMSDLVNMSSEDIDWHIVNELSELILND